MTDKLNLSEVIQNDRNKFHVTCTVCSCLILRSNDGYLVEEEMKLPALPKKVTQSDGKGAQATASDVNSKSIKTVDDSLTEEELLTHHWAVDDIFTFENLGFSKNVNDLKYLICAACEFGPIGVHKLSNKKSYVSLDRITYRKE